MEYQKKTKQVEIIIRTLFYVFKFFLQNIVNQVIFVKFSVKIKNYFNLKNQISRCCDALRFSFSLLINFCYLRLLLKE